MRCHQMSALGSRRGAQNSLGKWKIGYIVPEVGGTRYTTQNDGERLLYMLVGPKVMIIEVNNSVLIDM